MINNRQAGRRRGRGGNGGNGQRPGGNPGRPDNGNRIDNRARGNANQLYEKYRNLASDAQRQGDRVNTEYYLQFADHYFRVLSESRSRFDDQAPRRARDDNYVNGFDNEFDGDDEYGDEGEPIRAGEQGDEPRRDEQRPRDEQRQRDEPRQRDEQRPREEPRQRDEQRPREGGRDSYRENQRREPRRDEERRVATAANVPGDVAAEPAAEARANGAAPVMGDAGERGGEAVAGEPRRRGRPRRERAPESEVEGDAPVAIEADRLPPALSIGADSGEPAEGDPKPRRRRVRATPAGDAPQAG